MEETKPKRALGGKALLMKEAIFDKGVRITVRDWSKKLYGDENRPCAVYSILNRLKSLGYFVAAIKPDGSGVGLLTPITESRDIARMVNERQRTRINGGINSFSAIIAHELDVFPDMAKEIASDFQSTMDSVIALHKYTLAIEEPVYAKRLPGGNGGSK